MNFSLIDIMFFQLNGFDELSSLPHKKVMTKLVSLSPSKVGTLVLMVGSGGGWVVVSQTLVMLHHRGGAFIISLCTMNDFSMLQHHF